MIIKYLEELIKNEKKQNTSNLYIRNKIKEYLQILILEYLYTSNKYKSDLIFTGGTCLRHIYGIERLSEDLDFDLINNLNTEKLAEDINNYFSIQMKYTDLNISIKQKGEQILFKFPCLQKLNLATKNESNLLYIKMDLEKIQGKNFKTEKTSKNIFGSNFVALHYNLPTLFAGKINAILTRNLLVGKDNAKTIKGRDFYDLLWFLKNDIKINLAFLREKLNKDIDIEDLEKELNKKVLLATTKFKNEFENDLLPFISNQEFIDDYIQNYKDEFDRYTLIEDKL